MSNERGNFSNPEQGFNSETLQQLGETRSEKLRENLERNVENEPKNVEQARQEALEQATPHERKVNQRTESPAERRGPISKKERNQSFDRTMTEVRSHMSGPSRAFSKTIHHPVVEKVSDAVGGTIARPNAILSGSIFAFLFTLVIYLVARFNGYPLSGSESIAAFILGWVVGLVYDYIRLLIDGKR